jgi:lipopolysaccharide biosynthesis glycosyltransferase
MPDTRPAIHVAAACDENYAMPLAVMLASIAATLGEHRRVTVHVLETALGAGTREKIVRSVPRDRMELRWIIIDAERLAYLRDTLRTFDTVTLASYYRLLLPEVLPSTVEKVIYLDCDLVVNRDLGELWDLDVAGTHLLAAAELIASSRFVSSKAGIRLYRELGLPADLQFFNSGVMVINLRRWRQRHVAQCAIAYIREAGYYLRWHDQEALNVALAGEWIALDPRWNVTMHVFRGVIAKRQRAELARRPFIVHFNAAIKPWHHDFPFGFRELFFHHLDNTAWSGWRPASPRRSALSHWRSRVIRAERKRRHSVHRLLQRIRLLLHGIGVLRKPLKRIDRRAIDAVGASEIRLVVVADEPSPALSYLLTHYLASGADRALVALNGARRDVAEDMMRSHRRLHLFDMGSERRSRHEIVRHLLHRYGRGHWCVLVDADELLLYPHSEILSLKDLCTYLDRGGFEALACHVLDMVPPLGLVKSAYREGDDPRLFFPCFDPGHERIDSVLSDSLSRRVFTYSLLADVVGRQIGTLKCRSKVALLKYRSRMLIDSDLRGIGGARQADVTGAVLRFVHLRTGEAASASSRQGSCRYRDTQQLAQLGILLSAPAFEDLCLRLDSTATVP